MSLGKDYLSDIELEKLIKDVEEDLISAPPDMRDNILEKVEMYEDEKSRRDIAGNRKNILEFRQYCVRVITSVAAAIVLIIAVPFLAENKNIDFYQGEDLNVHYEMKSREELLAENKGFVQKIKDSKVFMGWNKFILWDDGGYDNDTEEKK